MNAEFAVYVVSTEWIKIKAGSFLSIKGNEIAAPLRGRDVPAKCVTTGERILIHGEGLSPSRPGMRGKMLAHVLREGSWSAKQPPKEAIDGSFLVPEDSRLKAYLYPVRLLSFYLECESEPFLPIKYAIPIEATVSGYRGVLLLRDEANGELQL